jgi:hypothetical protein
MDPLMNRQPLTSTRQAIPRAVPLASGVLQRRCSCGKHTHQGGPCSACLKKRHRALQRVAQASQSATVVPPIVHEVLHASGRPLDGDTQRFFGERFGQDFSQVRVHTDARAAESARAVQAQAYTVGEHVVFGTGQHAPGTTAGKQLLAHELTHVLQQRQTARGGPLRIGPPGDVYEREADRLARTVASGQSPAAAKSTLASPLRLQRLGANPGCTKAEDAAIHQGIYNARGWLNKAIRALDTLPLSKEVTDSIRRNFGPTYGSPRNAALIVGRLKHVLHVISTMPFACAGAADAICAAGHCGYAGTPASPGAGTKSAVICSNVTLVAGTDWIYQAGCMLHESFHAAYKNMSVDHYSGWHGHSGKTAPYPGPALDPLLNADSYTTLVIDLSK